MHNSIPCALIMAGGVGTRFWPKSTEKRPKQFLSLVAEKTMIQLTVDRIHKMIPIERIFICTSKKYKEIVKEQIPNLREANIILEPCARNTAPCILLSTLYIQQIYQNANIIVLPADHIIENDEAFVGALQKADQFVLENSEAIVTIGMTPTRPETGYGYIKLHDCMGTNFNKEIVKVEKFVEKPNLSLAKQYVDEKKYLWNAGMFIFNINSMLQEFKQHQKGIYEILSNLPSQNDAMYEATLEEVYSMCDKISIDYGIMEKSQNIYVIPSQFGWDDIGTWQSIERYIEKDRSGNIIKGNALLDNANDCIVYGNGKKIILCDVEDIFCIDSDDAIVIGRKDSISRIYKLKVNGGEE